MSQYSPEELDEILGWHNLWVNGVVGGVKASFDGKDLQGADFRPFTAIDFTGMSFNRANLRSANFCGLKLVATSFSEADLTYAEFRGANLFNANFSSAKLLAADLSRTNLSYVTFYDANIHRVNFDKADLNCVNLSHVDLYSVYFGDANLTYTIMPPGWVNENIAKGLFEELFPTRFNTGRLSQEILAKIKAAR